MPIGHSYHLLVTPIEARALRTTVLRRLHVFVLKGLCDEICCARFDPFSIAKNQDEDDENQEQMGYIRHDHEAPLNCLILVEAFLTRRVVPQPEVEFHADYDGAEGSAADKDCRVQAHESLVCEDAYLPQGLSPLVNVVHRDQAH